MGVPRYHDHWERENQRLDRAFADHGLQVRVINKRDGYEKWWEAVAMRLVSLLNRSAESSYITTFTTDGEVRIYWNTSSDFNPRSLSDFEVKRHELVHGLQAKRHGFQIFALLYILVLPIVLTFRAKFEREAYIESVRTWLEVGERDVAERMLPNIADQFTKLTTYGLMDPIRAGGFAPGGDVHTTVTTGGSLGETPLAEMGWTPAPLPF